MRVYISGPMTGYPDHNYPAFNEAAARWALDGFEVINPARNFDGDQTRPRAEYMRVDVQHVLNADAIAYLDGWQDSQGSRIEMAIADELGLPMYPANWGFSPQVTVQMLGPKVKPFSKISVVVDPVQAPAPAGALFMSPREFVETKGEGYALAALNNRPKVMDFDGTIDGHGYKASMDDPKKPPIALVPASLMRAAARSMGYGAAKYAPGNWLRGMRFSELYSALQRHMGSWLDGETADPESKLSHLDHAAFCLAALTFFAERPALYGQFDDRLFGKVKHA